ncbi:PQQ-dependent sugar dehydrogenase [Leptolyngbya sp. PCC 6406]|uniref:PQQ-dependent sugar dehydrogenase n=1 Tax=Leptolyngbya sp. PCC 6406 TaxID=1173264 RepID=UPI0002AC384C|nr:PQQ-dependent sugar dehydrogenase [Leptolyngbya sp. PCC 6406]
MFSRIRYQLPLTSGLAALLFLGCTLSPSDPPEPGPPDSGDSGESVSQGNATPPVVTSVRPVTLVESLEHPWGMDWLPDGSLLVTERPGRLRIIRDGDLDPTPVPGIPEVLAFGQGGLLDVAVHPNFAENQWVYFTYAHGSRDANETRVARARFDGNALTDWTVVFEVGKLKPDGQHFGARLAWLPDNKLLVAIGDGGNPPLQLDGELSRNQAQRLDSRLGKVVRINDDGSVPRDNPFIGTPDTDELIWTYGHRNIQGLVVDPLTQQVWATEHGARGGDELNLLEVGENYGWPLVTHSREYSGGEISSERSRPNMVDPKLVWTPSKAPSGLVVYRGDRYPQWQGQLFSGGLVSQDIRRIEVDDTGAVIAETSIAIGQRVRDVRQGPDGWLYVLTDDANGRLIRLDPE